VREATLLKTFCKLSLLVVASAIMLSACAGMPGGTTGSTAASVVDYNYAGADAIAAQLDKTTDTVGTVLVSSLANIDKLDSSSTFGRISADEIGSRLSQHGVRVLEARMGNSLVVKVGKGGEAEGEFMLSEETKSIAKQQRAMSVLVGTYADSGSAALVSLKLVRVSDSTIIASSDYLVPMTASTHEALFRVKEYKDNF
jgi:hypothetical protein